MSDKFNPYEFYSRSSQVSSPAPQEEQAEGYESQVAQPSTKRIATEVVHIAPQGDEGEGDQGDELGGNQRGEQEGDNQEGESPDDPDNEGRRSQEEEDAYQAEIEAKRLARERNPFWQFISGNWLILDGIAGTYAYLLVVAAALFLSVVSIFYSFHLGEKYTRRSAEVQLLRERELEFRQARFNATSHTAILRELERRGIPVYDIQESKTIIEK